MLASLLAVTDGAYTTPVLDWHALLPELILVGTIALGVIYDSFSREHNSGFVSTIAGFGFLAALVPLLTLGLSDDGARSMFGGAYMVDDFALVL
ncbi:hypothetical protein, partial [Acinetobacter baumannii]|uniref:hypothetical protein n=1 Tax=Acinetobacter baumannii TaxID=470 RepID=UPI0018E0BF01